MSAPGIAEVAGAVRVAVATATNEAEAGEGVAAVLRQHIHRDDLLDPEHHEGDPEAYRQHIVHVEDDGAFSIVCLVWLPGQVTPIHDHVSWCVVGVHQGEEAEERFRVEDDHLVPAGNDTNPQGTVVWLSPPGDIHRVRNAGPAKAIPIPVYGADISVLGSSIRRTYDLPVRT